MALSHRKYPSLILILIVAASAHVSTSFAPPNILPCRHHNGNINGHRSLSYPEPLFMNKKKKERPLPNSKGFADGSAVTSSSSSLSSVTSIKPKTSSNFRYSGSIRPGLQSPKRIVPSEKIQLPDYALDGKPKNRPALFPWVIEVKKPDEIEKMRAAGRLARKVLDLAGREARAGVTT